ncbi:CHAP domain-containing protein, partial [Sphaerisporangium sp. NPDC088356]|uniref:CHAP domain-containing protein n=1 Tax=Sphaerisporangium sp. NPDC088356 TaxID=3154871 RepID=UPI00343A7C7C
MSIHRLLDAPKNHLKAFTFGGLVVAQAVAGMTLAAHAASADDATHNLASAETAKAPETAKQVSAEQLLKIAERQVGISENSAGGGTKFHSWYMDSSRARETVARDGGTIAGYSDAAWCDMFVSWVGAQAGMQDTVGTDAYTVAHAKWFASHDRWGSTPKPGAVVFFDWGRSKSLDNIDHVGFVIKDNGDGTIKTVEGNAGKGAVEIRGLHDVARLVADRLQRGPG